MKKCLYCAEEIQDDAAVCRFCNNAVPQGATGLSYRGEDVVLGTSADGYALWRRASGELIETFPRTDPGWAEAWRRYQSLESHGAVATPRTNGMAVASLVLGIVWLWGLGAILALVFGYNALREIDRSAGTQAGRGLAVAGVVLGWIGVAATVLLLIASTTVVSSV